MIDAEALYDRDAMIELDGDTLTIEQLVAIADEGAAVALSPSARARVRAARAVVDRRADGRRAGLRRQHRVRIVRRDAHRPATTSRALQVNLMRSHAAGVGEPLPVRAVRASMALRANVLAKGFSGIRARDARAR